MKNELKLKPKRQSTIHRQTTKREDSKGRKKAANEVS